MIELKHDTMLQSAETQYGHPIQTYDDCLGPLWIAGQEYGPSFIVRAQSWESAYEIWINEQPTIAPDEVAEAYGFDGWGNGNNGKQESVYSPETAQARFEALIAKADAGDCEHPTLIEGYTYQSTASGTGIVATGHYEWLQELTPEYIRESGIRVLVRRCD